MRLNILLLCNKPDVGNDANTIVDHIEAIERYSNHHIWLYSNLGSLPSLLNLDKFDVIIIHYSLCLLNNIYISKKSKKRLREYNGLKVVFVQDEYRQINKMNDELQYLNIDVLFTCFSDAEKNKIYSAEKLTNVSKYTNLTGYIPERLIGLNNQIPIKERPISVGYRGRKLPYWYGELAYEKWNIVDKWFDIVSNDELTVDLSYNETDRIYGENWNKFLSSCKTTLGVESGASVMDFTGNLEKVIDSFQLLNPNESFEFIQKKYLLPYEGKYKLNQISPRCFEAIALKTVLVLYEGEYSGILIPNRHYIMLKKDFSNIQEVIRFILDDEYLQNMADTAFQEIALNPEYTYRSFIKYVDEVICSEFLLRNKLLVQEPYINKSYNSALRWLKLQNKIKKRGFLIYLRLPPSFRLIVKLILRPKQLVYAFQSRYKQLVKALTKV